MAPQEEKHVFQSIRNHDNFNGGREHPGYLEDDIERPATSLNDSSTDVDDNLERIETTKSTRERHQFEPVTTRDRDELQRIASAFSGKGGLSRTNTGISGTLERLDTLAGVNIGDPVLDPDSPEFDVYKWSRMFVLPAILATSLSLTN